MITIMPVQAPYFFSLATILLERKGTKDPFGLTYVDNRAEIRGSGDGKVIQVRNKGIASNVPDMVVASRGPDGETFEKQHNILASHLQWRAAECFPGAHVFVFSLEEEDGSVAERTVFATGLVDAHGHVSGGRRLRVRDLLKAMSPEQAETNGLDLAAVEATPALEEERELARLVRDAEGSPDQVYVFTFKRPGENPGSSRGIDTPPIRAAGLADAEEAALAVAPAGMRVARIGVETLPEFYAGYGKSAAARSTMILSPAVRGRQG